MSDDGDVRNARGFVRHPIGVYCFHFCFVLKHPSVAGSLNVPAAVNEPNHCAIYATVGSNLHSFPMNTNK